MKKVFLTLTLAAFAFAANAQFIVGGSLGYNNFGGKTTNETKTTSGSDVTETINATTSYFWITPKIGYQINDNMQAGLIVGFRMNQDKRVSGFSANELLYADWEGTRNESYNTITIKPYFRYNVMELGDFKLFVEAQVPIQMESVTKWKSEETYTDPINGKQTVTGEGDDKTSNTVIGINVIPGLNYSLTDNISVDVYFNAIGLAYTHTQRTFNNPDAPVGGTLNRTITDNDFDFGCNALNSGISVGFNYAF